MTAQAKKKGFTRTCACLPWNPAHEREPIGCCVCGERATHYLRHIDSGLAMPRFRPTDDAARATVDELLKRAKSEFDPRGRASMLDVCVHLTCDEHKSIDAHHIATPLVVAYPKFFGVN